MRNFLKDVKLARQGIYNIHQKRRTSMASPSLSTEFQKKVQLDALSQSATKPLYITSVSVDGDNQFTPLSDALYKSILDPVLSQPLQNIDNAMNNFSEIKKKLFFTGLFQDVKITLDNDVSGASFDFLKENVSKEYGVELPLPTVAKIDLIPALYNKLCLTSGTSDMLSSMGGRISFINALGKAETLILQSDINYVPFSGKLNEKSLDGKFLLPLQKNPSIKAVIDVNYAGIDLFKQPFLAAVDQHKQQQYSFNIGVQKNWLCNKTGNAPILFNGVSTVIRNLYGFNDIANVSESIKQFNGSFIKSSFVSQITNDTRKFVGLFPISGSRFNLVNEYVLTQAFSKNKTVPQENNFDKACLSYEHHNSYLNNRITSSLDFSCGAIIPTGSKAAIVHTMDRFYLGGLKSLKGFELNTVGSSGGNFFYRLGITSSYRLPNATANSPLRFQVFFNAGDSLNKRELPQSFAAATGFSVVYKTALANMDLTYALPLTEREQDVAKPGFSFGVELSFF